MDVLVRIKRLVVARQVEFALKAEEERLRDGLGVEAILRVGGQRQGHQDGSAFPCGGTNPPRQAPLRAAAQTGPGDLRPRVRSDMAGYGPCPTCGSRRGVAVDEDVTFANWSPASAFWTRAARALSRPHRHHA